MVMKENMLNAFVNHMPKKYERVVNVQNIMYEISYVFNGRIFITTDFRE